ncbi:hypothetical protein M0804_008921 [Polistes exclamans]|nr:hypothetical protein M0804_008921 [Polistes exclamans]
MVIDDYGCVSSEREVKWVWFKEREKKLNGMGECSVFLHNQHYSQFKGGGMGLREAERKGTSVPTIPTDASNVDGGVSVAVVIVVVVVVFGRVEHLESGQSVVEHVKAIYDQSQNRKRKESSILVALGRDEDVYLGN